MASDNNTNLLKSFDKYSAISSIEFATQWLKASPATNITSLSLANNPELNYVEHLLKYYNAFYTNRSSLAEVGKWAKVFGLKLNPIVPLTEWLNFEIELCTKQCIRELNFGAESIDQII